jgi:CxxC motif-containing protein
VVPLVPVRTDVGIRKQLVFKVIEKASSLRVQAPVRSGQILWENIFDTGVNLIVTKTLEAVE